MPLARNLPSSMDLTCRDARHPLSRPDVRRHNRTGADHGVVADADAFEDDRVCADPDIITHRDRSLDQRLSRNRALLTSAVVMVGDVAIRPYHALGPDTYAHGCIEHREPIDVSAAANAQSRPRVTRPRRQQHDLVIQRNQIADHDIPWISRHVNPPDPAFATKANTEQSKP